MHIYYRVSDNSYKKPKLIGATKEVCLMNFCTVFRETIFGKSMVDSAPPDDDWLPPMKIIADKCERTTTKMLMESGIPLVVTDLGNAGSLLHAVEMASQLPDDELVYLCEDDYLHFYTAPKLLEEGIKRSEYVSLYDHPDKYTRFYNGGEYSKVIRTASSHWRFTASTCMTFASKAKTLREDLDVFRKFCDNNHPHDHHIFVELAKKGRKLVIPIPGVACHTDLTFSGEMNDVLIEPWAIELMIAQLYQEIGVYTGIYREQYQESFLKTGWERLVALDALRLDLRKHKESHA